jgi:hypothetical protein
MILSLSLDNHALYQGLEITVDAGKRNLRTPPDEAIAVMVRNLGSMDIDPSEVVLTGAMAIWAYLAVFHALHGRTRRIWYEDGLGQRILVAAHG